MRALTIAAVAVAAVATLASCANDAGKADEPTRTTPPSQVSETPSVTSPPGIAPGEPDPSGSKPTETSAPVSLSPSGDLIVPPGVQQVPAAQIDVSALPAYYEHHGDVWVFDEGYSLEMFAAASSGCSDAEAVVVDQSDSDVRITLRPLPQQPGGRPDGGACTAVMTPKPVMVRLTKPLDDRKIYLGIGR
jgi:hypothetical protein